MAVDAMGFEAKLAIPDIELGDGPIETDSCPFMLVTETCAPVRGSVKLSVENELAERPGVPTGAPAATAARDDPLPTDGVDETDGAWDGAWEGTDETAGA